MAVTTLDGNIAKIKMVDVTVDIGSVAANTTEEEEITVPGVKTGDFVAVSKPSLEAGILFGSCRVSADDTVKITVTNPTGSGVNEGSETLTFMIMRPESGVSDTAF